MGLKLLRRRQELVAFYDVDALLVKIEIVMCFGFLDSVFTTGAFGRHMLIAVDHVLVLCLINDLLLNLYRFLVVTNVVDR